MGITITVFKCVNDISTTRMVVMLDLIFNIYW